MLKYSFSEVNHTKTMPILDFKEKDNLEINLSEIKPLRDMREIKGPIEKLVSKEVYSLGNQEDYIRAIITNEDEVFDAIGQLRRIYPNILKLEIKNSKTEKNLEIQEASLEAVKEKTELELFNEFYKMQNNQDLNDEQLEIMKNIIEEIKSEE
jgi:exonuclease SbcD